MCRVHGTDCAFPEEAEQSVSSNSSPVGLRASKKEAARRRLAPILPAITSSPSVADDRISPPVTTKASSSATINPWAELRNEEERDYQPTPLSIGDTEQENTHIVGPANTADSQVLADYLSIINTDNGGMRMVRPVPASRSKPVLFSTVQKRPIGVEANTSQAREKLHIIEQFLAPYAEQLIDL
jgi:hypothetical protein